MIEIEDPLYSKVKEDMVNPIPEKSSNHKWYNIRWNSEEVEDKVGEPINPERLTELFGEDGRVKIQTFANALYTQKWDKFAVSTAEFRFSTSPKLMFFEVGKLMPEEKGVQIIYLGTGRTDKIPEIGNEVAADTWGFAVLRLSDQAHNAPIEVNL